MTRFLTYFAALCAVFGILSIGTVAWYVFFPSTLPTWMSVLDPSQVEAFSSYVKGLPVVFFSAATVSFVFLTYLKQRDDAARSQVAVTRQVFDSTFFTMLSTLHELRGGIEMTITITNSDRSDKTISGTAFFQNFRLHFYSHFYGIDAQSASHYPRAIKAEERLKSLNKDIQRIEVGDLRKGLSSAFIQTLDNFDTQMGNYLRFLSSILVFISNGPADERKRYADMIQNQLSGYELMLLFYAGLAEYRPKGADPKTLYNLIQQYGLVDTIEPVHLLNEVHAMLYPKVAFRFLKNAQLRLREDLSKSGVLGLSPAI